MKKIHRKSISLIGVIVAITLLVWACSKDNELANHHSATVGVDNSEILMATQEALDITDGSLEDQGISDGRAASGGRIEAIDHGSDWENCGAIISGTFSIDRTHPDSLIFSGSLTIDYKDGAACKDSTHVKKGKVVDNFVFIFNWRQKLLSSTQNISFSGFTRGSTIVDGVFIAKSVRHGTSSIEFQGAKLTYKDGTSVSWDGQLMSEYNNAGTTIRSDDTRKITGSINGTARDGNAFSAEISKEILFKYSCSIRRIPVSGTLVVTSGTVTTSIDFGDGTCDKVYTTSSAGVTEQHNL